MIKGHFAEVILPLPLYDLFTYRIPENLTNQVTPGKRVIVQFGKKKIYSGIVVSVHDRTPGKLELKEILSVLDEKPVVSDTHLKFWHWIARYYMCSPGEVMKAALPSGMNLESASLLRFHQDSADNDVTEKERMILDCLGANRRSIDEIRKSLGREFSFGILKQLIDRGFIHVEESIGPKHNSGKQKMVLFNPEIDTRSKFDEILAGIKKAEKQKELLIHIAEKMDLFSTHPVRELPASEIIRSSGISGSVLNLLVKKNILHIRIGKKSRFREAPPVQPEVNPLTESQKEAFNKIKEFFRQKKVVLLHGITASGKTEIFIHLAEEVVRQGLQILYLVPEISLTPQIINKLQDAFGSRVCTYHSKLGDSERIEIWNKTADYDSESGNSFQIVLGARSALFLPFARLGLIIVDEEHENSYKQFDSAPRYNARDMAAVLGQLHKVPVILGSATPSFESYLNSKTGKYGYVPLLTRFGEARFPEIIIADLHRARKRRKMHSLLTPELFEKISTALNNGEQVVLFQNRRGYSPYAECNNCGWVPFCKNCNVPLTWHRNTAKFTCHYCGYNIHGDGKCSKCGAGKIEPRGFGTEKVEDEMHSLFPGTCIARMDVDTTHSKFAFSRIIDQMEKGKISILIGTQMVTKGLDLENVTVAGVLNADNLLNVPDFRAHERAYQLLAQVSGRAGRMNKQGTVVIQTTQPDHPVIMAVAGQNFEEFYNTLTEERKTFKYPPWYRLIKISLKHTKTRLITDCGEQMAGIFRQYPFFTVLGPEAPLISRIRNSNILEIWLKYRRDHNLTEIQNAISDTLTKVRKTPGNHSINIQIDVDAM